MSIEIKSFCLGCGKVSKARVGDGDVILKSYSGTPVPAWCNEDECQVKHAIFEDTADQTERSLYKRLVNAGCEIDHHESDLYVKKTPLSEVLVERYATVSANVTVFKDDIDDDLWYDVPFSYEPFYRQPRVVVAKKED